MKIIKRFTALMLAVLMLALAAGCNTKAEWSYKTQDKELAIGVYIYALYSAYNQAASLASEVEGYESGSSFLNLEIKDEDDEAPLKAEEWIKQKADEMCRVMLAVDSECRSHEVTLSNEDLNTIKEAAESDWKLGPNYQYYSSMGYLPSSYESILYPHGVSFDSFKYGYYETNQMQYELFCKMYKEGGEKAVSEDELKDFFYDNYTSYKYFTVALTKSEESDDGSSSTVAMTDSEKKEVIDKMQKYVDDINDGSKNWDDTIKEYMEAEEIESDPTTSRTEILEDSTINDDVKKAIEDLSDSKADIVEVGSDTSAILYVVYKTPLADAEEDSLGTEEASESVLVEYKHDEFQDYIENVAEGLSISVNSSAINNYKPSMFE